MILETYLNENRFFEVNQIELNKIMNESNSILMKDLQTL